jgi:hypothetical protein
MVHSLIRRGDKGTEVDCIYKQKNNKEIIILKKEREDNKALSKSNPYLISTLSMFSSVPSSDAIS